jgi:hypothetical protein
MRAARILLAGLLALGCGPGADAARAPRLALREVGPWPWVSSLVAHRGRLWFANGDRSRDRSCADLYSLGLAGGDLRYERHLFSQGVGRPAVHQGLLYWPYEDSRFSLGVAHVAVTDGASWRLLTIDDAQPLVHATALASDERTLWLTTANPSLRLLASPDAGASWRPVGPAPGGREGLRWVLRAAPFAGGLYGVVVDGIARGARRRLARIDSGRPARLPGLPAELDVRELVVHESRLLALVEASGGDSLWWSDGARSERFAEAPPRGRLADVATSADGRLWALTVERGGGRIWQRSDATWRLEARLEGGLPQELAIVEGRPYAAGHAGAGAGALWTPAAPAASRFEYGPPAALPELARSAAADWRSLEARARAALEQPASYLERARGARDALLELARSGAPPEAFERLLAGPFPEATATFLEDEIPVPARLLGPWLALWSVAVSGRGRVPPALLAAPWPERPLGAREKHFETLLAALEAISWNGQADVATVDALQGRLGASGDPDWLRGDLVGALSAVTGQRHGYDAEAWRRWWRGARAEWRARDAEEPAPRARLECGPCLSAPSPPPS